MAHSHPGTVSGLTQAILISLAWSPGPIPRLLSPNEYWLAANYPMVRSKVHMKETEHALAQVEGRRCDALLVRPPHSRPSIYWASMITFPPGEEAACSAWSKSGKYVEGISPSCQIQS